MVKKFRHSCLVVNNLKKSLKFYKDILGLKVFKKLTVKGTYPERVFNLRKAQLTYVKLYCGRRSNNTTPVFELHYWHYPRRPSTPGYNHISFTVDNIENEYKRLSKKGVRFISPPITATDKKTKICFGYDPDNNLIEFIQDLKKDFFNHKKLRSWRLSKIDSSMAKNRSRKEVGDVPGL